MAEVGVDIGWADNDPDVVVGAGVASRLPATGNSLP